MTPKVSEPAKISSGGFAGDVNLFSGAYSSSIPLGEVSTPGGLSYSLSLNYSSSFNIGNTSPISKGIPYGDGWNLNLPTISVEAEAFNNFSFPDYCNPNGNPNPQQINYTSLGSAALNEGDLYWFSPYINIPGVASGRAVFKYIDASDNMTVVFELNSFENHVEIRFDNMGWTVITADGTIYELNTAIQSYNAPANKRVLNYDVSGAPGNQSWNVAASGYITTGTAALVENSILPKQRYNLWYCNSIRHKNKPLQSIVFFYEGFGKFNYFKEFQQEAYKYAASTQFASTTFPIEHDFSCYTDLLLKKVESYSVSGLVNKLELKYETEKNIINANSTELIRFNQPYNGRLDSLYSYQSVVREGLGNTDFGPGWNRYRHSKSSTITDGYAVNPSNPYLINNTSYLRNTVTPDLDIPFDHSFLESPRLLSGTLVPGDVYEVKTKISRSNAEQLKNGNSTIDVSIVSGTLNNQDGTTNNAFNSYNNNSGNFFDEQDFNDSRGIALFSTFNMAMKWTLSYSENLKQTSNLFVMPNLPTAYHGFNVQIGPGNSDMSYQALPSTVHESTGLAAADKAYYYRYGTTIHPVSDINPTFGLGFPWAMMIPIYKQMVTALNAFESTGYTSEVFNVWYNLVNSSTTPWQYDNIPTKMDNSVKLEEMEVLRYSKNPYMLKYVEFYNVNGDVGGLVETGLHLISKKEMEYTSERGQILENYDYQDNAVLKYKSNVMQVFVLLNKVREIPLYETTADTSRYPTTFFSYTTFKSTGNTYDISQPLNGYTGKLLEKISDHLGGITKVEYYPALDSRTHYTNSFSRTNSCSGVSASSPFGLSESFTVHPVVKYVLKNDEEDLVKTNAASSNAGHTRWHYDFDVTSKVYKQTEIENTIPNFFSGRSASFDVGFKTVSVYGSSLTEGGNTYVNKTVYDHHGYKKNSGTGTPTIEDYLYHGKLKSIKEYNVNNKLFTEKLINYEYTMAYQNGYDRPNPLKENLVWEQQYDNPGGQYEYRDYYLNLPLVIGGLTGPAAYSQLDVRVFNGSGEVFEQPKYLEFYFYPQLKADTARNPKYLFHSYFVKKKEEINRKYDDYYYKQQITSMPDVPEPWVNVNSNPFGSGFTNPVLASDSRIVAQINLIENQSASTILDSLIDQSPVSDTVLHHVMTSGTLSFNEKASILLAQENLSNESLIELLDKLDYIVSERLISIVRKQRYISDEVLIAVIPRLKDSWDPRLVEELFFKNDYLSTQVLEEFTGPGLRHFDAVMYTKLMARQPQMTEEVINNVVNSKFLIPADLSTILANQVITEDNYSNIIAHSGISDVTIAEIIESGGKYPSEVTFGKLINRGMGVDEMERVIAAADRDIESAILNALIVHYGNLPFLSGFVFRGNPLSVYCNNPVLSNWNYIETKTTYEYYEADYKGASPGRAYKVLMGLTDIPGRTVSVSDVFGTGGTKTVNTLCLKHEPSWQVFSVTNTSVHLPTAKDEKQYFYLYDLKNRYDRYWYYFDINEVNGESSDFSPLVHGIDTLMYTFRWDDEYSESYMMEEAPVSPKYDGMTKSRQYGMRSTPFQQTHITKNQRDSKELQRSEYYFYDSRWRVDPFSRLETVLYDGPECPEVGNPPVNPVSCESCMRWKYGTEEEFIYQLPFNYCLWKDPVVGYYACPSSINYALCYPGVELVSCYPKIAEPEEEGDGPTKMIILTDALKKSLQLRSTVIQVDTLSEDKGISRDFIRYRFDRRNNYVADFYMEGSGTETDDQGFIHPYRMFYPYDTLTTARVHKRNEHLQPALISNEVGLQTRFYYNSTINKWNVDTNCTNPSYSFLYNYSSVETFNIGLPVRVTVGYNRPDSLSTLFSYTNDGQVKRMTFPSGSQMEYDFDAFNRLIGVQEDGRLLSRNEYHLWEHDFTKNFKDRSKENFVYSVLYQNDTDTMHSREFQKSFTDPLGRTWGTVRAYGGDGDVRISSGSVQYDNWGRVIMLRKPSVAFNLSTPIIYDEYLTGTGSDLHYGTKYDHDPVSLDVRHSDPGILLSDNHTVKKETCIVNNVYMSCELGLNASELYQVMNQGVTGAFRFKRTSEIDQDNKRTDTYTNAVGQTVATLQFNIAANVPEKLVTLYIYDSYGNLSRTINPLRQNTDYQYNMLGQLIREKNVDGGEKRFIYNKQGKISGVQDQIDRVNMSQGEPAPRFRKFEYNAYGNMVRQSLVTNSYHIDPFCFQDKLVGDPSDPDDSQGYPQYFDYVFTNRMSLDWLNHYKTLDPFSEIAAIEALGLPSVAPHGTSVLEKEMTYGASQAYPDYLGKLIESLSYNLDGNPIQRIYYHYHLNGLLREQLIIQHPTDVNTYDQFSVRAKINYPEYNLRKSLLVEELDMEGDGSIEMKYFNVYDGLNRLREVKVTQGNQDISNATLMATYSYDEARGTVSKKSHHLGSEEVQTHTYMYDDRDRLKTIWSSLFIENLYYDDQIVPGYNTYDTNTLVQNYCYNGNVNGTRAAYNFGSSGIDHFYKPTTYGYSYDGINRLTFADASVGDWIDASYANSSNLTPQTSYRIGDEKMSYDKIGNIRTLERIKRSGTLGASIEWDAFIYTYASGANRLLSIYEQSTASNRYYSYDLNGNLLSDSYRYMFGTTYGRSSYPYEISKPSQAGNISYLYDGGDQRIFKKIASLSQTTQEMYIKDALGRDLSIVSFVTSNNTTAKNTEYYVYGTDRIARVVSGDSYPRVYDYEATFFIYDHLGNTRVSYESQGNQAWLVRNAIDYYPYGKILREYDGGAGDRYLTTGHERDKETRSDYRGARYYDSDVARFLSLDPMAAKYPNFSAYNYVGNNPAIFIDPDGKDYIGSTTLVKNSDGKTYTMNTKITATYYVVDATKNKVASGISPTLGSKLSETQRDPKTRKVDGKTVTSSTVTIEITFKYVESLSSIPNGANALFIVDAAKDEPNSKVIGWGETEGNKAVVENTSNATTLKSAVYHEIGHNFGMDHQEGGTMASSVNGKTTYGLATLLKQTFWLTNENIGPFSKAFGTGNTSNDLKSFLNESTVGGYRSGAVK